jgi:hypothetical protein
MRMLRFLALAGALTLAGCDDGTSPRDLTPPASPRGVVSVTGDGEVFLSWLQNTEGDVAGYRIYESDCDTGPNCPYLPVGSTTQTQFTLTGLANGVTRYFAVAAYDYAGNESKLSKQTIFDTPRPEGFGARLSNYLQTPASGGWDFSAFHVRAWDDASTDMFYGYNGTVFEMFVPDLATDIQDAGYASSLDAVDFSPTQGWSPTGAVELIVGHCYIVWTRDNHYAKFRVTSFVTPSSGDPQVEFDWAYQVDAGNRELKASKPGAEGSTRRPIAWVR